MFVRLYRLALRLLPPDFRRSYGASLVQEVETTLEERGSARARLRAEVALLGDLARAVLREWWDAAARTLGAGWSGATVADVRWAARSLRRSPGYALTVVGTLGFGIGASTAAFGLTDAYLLRSLPYPDSDQLMALWPDQNWSRHMVDMSSEGLPSLEGLGGYGGATLVLDDAGEPEEILVSTVTTNVHGIVGVAPELGRGFLEEDGEPGAEPVAILSHALFTERFGSDPSILGRSIALAGEGRMSRTVVGVMPADYLPLLGPGVDAWIPVTMDRGAASWSDSYFMQSVARLRSGATPARAADETRAWARRVRESAPEWFSEEEVRRASAVSLAYEKTSAQRLPLTAALCAALLVLLVACANVTNLVIARTVGRERELSVRAALGAGRLGTARVVLAEVALLAGLGAAAGLGVAFGSVGLLERRMPEVLPAWGLAFDVRWIAAAVVLAALAALTAGAVPSLQAAQRDPARSMSAGRSSTASRSLRRFQGLMAASQLALATAGVAALGVLGRSLGELARVDLGFDGARSVTFRVTAPPAAYPDDADVSRFFRDIGLALGAVPGVERAGVVSRLPLSGGESKISVNPEGWQRAEGEPAPEAWHRLITPGYLEALGARLVEGRIPGPDDDRADLPKLVVINGSAATRFWPGESAVGKHFRGPAGVVWLTVAGVIEDIRERGQQGQVIPGLYIPHRDWPWRTMHAVVRARAAPEDLVPALKEAVWSVAPGTPISRVQTLERVVARGLRLPRILTALAGVAGGVTLLLGALGVYGTVSHMVARRKRELGVRAALGADRGRLLRGELRQTTGIVSTGLGVGLVLSWMAGQALARAVPGIKPMDLSAFAGAVILLGVVAYLAALLPARRAAQVDPVQVIRND